jgi:hypothetical protein
MKASHGQWHSGYNAPHPDGDRTFDQLHATVNREPMAPTCCLTCQSKDLVHGRLFAHNGVTLRFSLLKAVAVSGAACLTCGAVIPYLDDTALNKVRAWKDKESVA